MDSAGVVYVADTGNHRIRRVQSDGKTTAFAGSGSAGFADGSLLKASFRSPEVGRCKLDIGLTPR